MYFKVMLMLTEKHIVLHCDRVGGFTRGLLVNSPGLSPRFASSPARGRAQCSICGDTRCSELDVMNWMSRLFWVEQERTVRPSTSRPCFWLMFECDALVSFHLSLLAPPSSASLWWCQDRCSGAQLC